MGVEVLTREGGKYPISEDLRAMLALTNEGELFVGQAYLFNMHVRGFQSRLNQQNVKFNVVPSDISVVQKMYESSTNSKEAHTDMESASIDLFARAVKRRASDIHVRVSERQNTRIFFRVHNDLEFIEEHSHKYGEELCSTIYHAMADVSDATFEVLSRQDARISDRKKIPKELDGIRIATTPQVGGFVFVMRLLYNDTADDFDLKRLGFSDTHVAAIEYMKRRPTGVIIISGPTGSGKSTTLQRTLGSVIKETMGKKHIITVEDPPEYPIPGAVQTPVTNAESEEDRSKEYQKAIKAAMRLDPDIIMLSEVRDQPTAKLTIQAAMTGHQVWTTVHSNTALGTFDRFRDLGVEQELLTDTTVVAGVIGQRLVKTLCPHCSQKLVDVEKNYSESDINRFMRVLKYQDVRVQGNGCDQCDHTGTLGRTVVAETIVTDNTLMKHIREGDRMGSLKYVFSDLGHMTMLEHAIEKVNQGLVDPFLAEDVVGLLDTGAIEGDHRITPQELAGSNK